MPSVSDSFSQVLQASTEADGSPTNRKLVDAGWLLLALILFAVQVLPYLSYRWVTDESWFAGTGYSIATGQGVRNPGFGPNYLVSRFDAHPPGTALIIATAFKLLGTSEMAARAGSVVAGAIIVLLVYFLGRRVIGRRGALLAVLLMATDNLLVLTSRTARPEALTAMAVLAAMLAMQYYAERGRLFHAFASGLLMAASTMFHITVAGFLVSLGIIAILADRSRGRMPLRGALAYAGSYILGLAPFVIWILTAPLGVAGFREEFMGRAGAGFVSRFMQEGHRYSDLLGLNVLHGHGLESLPIRLPIPLFLIAVSYLLWKFCRKLFYLELLLLIPTALWFAYVPDKMPRYLVLISPVLALGVGAALSATAGRRRLQSLLIAASVLTIIAQLTANMLLLHEASKANFPKLSADLRRAIPPGETAYGTITFWMALRDYRYIAYERTEPTQAADEYHARYFIADDRVMEDGLANDEAFYVHLRSEIAGMITRSTLVAVVSDPYYGKLKIYKLNLR